MAKMEYCRNVSLATRKDSSELQPGHARELQQERLQLVFKSTQGNIPSQHIHWALINTKKWSTLLQAL